jgi:hypothetical protein
MYLYQLIYLYWNDDGAITLLTSAVLFPYLTFQSKLSRYPGGDRPYVCYNIIT